MEREARARDTGEPAPGLSARRRRTAALAAALALSAGLVGLVVVRGLRDGGEPSRCGDGLVALGPRCCGEGQRLEDGRCAGMPSRCGAVHVAEASGCALREPEARVRVSGGRLRIGPGDWEAQGVVTPREAEVAAFDLDAFEVTEGRWAKCVAGAACRGLEGASEPARAVSGVAFDEAAAFCGFAGGRLPSSDELAFAISGAGGRRYPWGDTGAVCRRGAWGLAAGPCANGGAGSDLAGAHPDGATAGGVHDLAGNVAEWALPADAREGFADVLGGSWADAEAAALRGWNRRTVPRPTRSAAIGFRCVYAPR